MAIIQYINNETARDGHRYLGDVIGVFPDSHQFSPTELIKFNYLTIGGSVQDVKARLDQLKPQIENAYLWESDNEYHFNEDGDLDPLETIRVFRAEGSKRWYKLVEKFRYPINLDTLTPEEKQVLETVDINHSSVDSFIRKLIKDITVLSGNDVEIIELRNTNP